MRGACSALELRRSEEGEEGQGKQAKAEGTSTLLPRRRVPDPGRETEDSTVCRDERVDVLHAGAVERED